MRNVYFDFEKGLAILEVVSIHKIEDDIMV